MKRIIFIFWIAMVSSGWLMANHWTPNSTPYEGNMTLTGIVRIDGIEQQTATLEVGAFCGEECRGSAQLTYFSPAQHYVAQLLIYGNSGDSITFSLYDHGLNEELDLITYDVVTVTSDGYGSLANPYMLNFYSLPPGPHLVTVSAYPEVGGTVSGSGTYDHGTTATLTATANEDYRFVNWTKDGEEVSSSATYSFIVTEPGDYIAHFELSITHHWIPDAMLYENNMTLTGVIQINGQEQQNPMLEVGVFCGEECRGSGIPTYFAPMQRYVVQILIYGESGDQLTFRLYDHEFNEEFELYATHAVTFATTGCGSLAIPRVLNFTETVTEMHDITATVNLEGSGTIMGTGTYLNGTTCTLTATANDNYQFVNWTENGTMVSTSSSYAFEVTSNRSFVANFVPIESNHWMPNAAPYGDNMTLTGVVQINFIEQQTSALEVGAFCGEECRGTERLTFFPPTQRYVVQLIVYGNEGDQLTFRLFDHGVNEELNLVFPDPVAFMSDGYGSLQNPYVLNFELNSITQTSDFSSGYNWWSTYIEQEGIDGLEMLESSLDDNGVAIRSQASGYTDYYGEDYGWWGSLASINNESSYRVVTNAPCTVTMTGNEAVPSQHPITLNHGWTWLGYVPSTAMDVNVAMAGMEAVVGDKLKSQQGYSEYNEGYGWYGSLSTIEPGMGLMYYSSSSQPVTFTYPDNNDRGGELKDNLTAEKNHWVPNVCAYPDNMTVTAIVELDRAELQSEHYELAAFVNGECRGSAQLMYVEPLNRYLAFLTIVGDEAADLYFGLYDAETEMECFNTRASLKYMTNAIVGNLDEPSVISFCGTTGVEEFDVLFNVFPNPVSKGEELHIVLPSEDLGKMRMEIVDALGAMIETVSSLSVQSIPAPNLSGIYALRITIEGKGVYCRKLVVK